MPDSGWHQGRGWEKFRSVPYDLSVGYYTKFGFMVAGNINILSASFKLIEHSLTKIYITQESNLIQIQQLNMPSVVLGLFSFHHACVCHFEILIN